MCGVFGDPPAKSSKPFANTSYLLPRLPFLFNFPGLHLGLCSWYAHATDRYHRRPMRHHRLPAMLQLLITPCQQPFAIPLAHLATTAAQHISLQRCRISLLHGPLLYWNSACRCRSAYWHRHQSLVQCRSMPAKGRSHLRQASKFGFVLATLRHGREGRKISLIAPPRYGWCQEVGQWYKKVVNRSRWSVASASSSFPSSGLLNPFRRQ